MTTALYIRVSTDAQAEEGYSIDEQKIRLRKYCESRNINDFQYYIDGGYSGSNTDRPEIKRLVEDCKNGVIENIIVYKLDRLSRSQKDTLYLIEEVFLPHNIGFISINESFDTNTPFGRAMIGILSVFAQLERENIRERTRMGMVGRLKEGYWPGGGRIPFGYDYDAKEGTLIPNRDADTVRKIYDLYLQGESTYRISEMVGMKYERLVQQILTRKSNTGIIIYNGVEYQGRHEPIISLETYNKTMEMMEARSKSPCYSDSPHLLTGLLECGVCGAKYRYQKSANYHDRCKLYCYSRQKSKRYLVKDPDCDNIAPWADDVEKVIIEQFFNNLDRFDVEEPADKFYVTIMDELLAQKVQLENKLKRLYNLFGDSGDETLLDTINDVKKQMASIAKRIEREQEKTELVSERDKIIQKVMGVRDLWDNMTKKEKYLIIHECIEKITITYNEIKISYNF